MSEEPQDKKAVEAAGDAGSVAPSEAAGSASEPQGTRGADAPQAEKAPAAPAKQAPKAEAKPKTPTKEASEAKTPAAPAKQAPETEAETPAEPAKKQPARQKVEPKQKPELDDETKHALEVRDEKNDQRPRFRRQEWFRYRKLGGKHAPWRRPTGIHSKQRRHYKYRPPLVSVGYRGPAAARGLHPSGFEEVPVHRPEDLDAIDAKTQAARVGGTVGGRKAERIEKRADELGIRVLNRRSS